MSNRSPPQLVNSVKIYYRLESGLRSQAFHPSLGSRTEHRQAPSGRPRRRAACQTQLAQKHTLLDVVGHGIPGHAGRQPARQACTLRFCPFVFDILPIPDDIILPMQLCHHQEVFISQKVSATVLLKFPEVLQTQGRNNKFLNSRWSKFSLQIPRRHRR